LNPMALISLGFPVVVIVLVVISLYKVFVKKKSATPFYTPFDEITGQTEVLFHEEQEVHLEDPGQGDDKDR
jgi:Ni,Fe-hydrogenase I cytochrome b subunit